MTIGKSISGRNSALGVLTALVALGSTPALAQGDAANGEKIFRRCSTCHNIGEGAKNKSGPVLTGVIGRQAGTYEGFNYGKSIIAAGEAGLVWSEDEIFTYLEDPRKFLSEKLDDKRARSKMAFKLRKEEDRRDVIAYVASFSPAAAAEEAEGDAAADAAASE